MIVWEEIEKNLTSDNEEIRLQGLRELPQLGVEERLSAVFRALGDDCWRVRKEAANLYLSLPGAGRLSGQVAELLHSDDNAGLRNSAAEILVRLGRQSVPYLLEELSCADHDVRKFVLDILGEISDDSAVPFMEKMVFSDPDENVRAAAAENLGKLRSVESVPVLLDALSAPNLLLRFTILEALSLIGAPVPVARLIPLHEDKLLRKPLYDCLGRIGSGDATNLLISGLNDPMRNVREAAAYALSRFSDKGSHHVSGLLHNLKNTAALEPLFEMLGSPTLSVRRAAVKLIGVTGDPRAAQRLLTLLDDDELRNDAAQALTASGKEAVCALIQLWPEASPRTRIYLAYVFAEVGCVEALGLLVSALYASDAQLRIAALLAVGRLGDASEVSAVAHFLGDDAEEVRNVAADALVNLGSSCRQEIVDILLAYGDDDRAGVRCASIQVLGRLGGREIEPILMLAMKDESAQVRRSAIRFLDGKTPEHRQALTLALNDEESDVRRQAVETLAGTNDPIMLPALSLALSDDDIWVRTAAIRALGRIENDEALDYIRRGLRDPVGLVTIAALETLAEVDPTGSIEDLCAAFHHPDDEVVSAALRLLTRLDDHRWLKVWGPRLIDHRHWDVRLTVSRLLAERLGTDCLGLLAARLLVEGEEVVREQLREIVESLAERRE